MEFVLHGLAEHSLLSKNVLVKGVQFKDLFNSLMGKSNDRSMGRRVAKKNLFYNSANSQALL